MGFIEETGAAQHYRDARIAADLRRHQRHPGDRSRHAQAAADGRRGGAQPISTSCARTVDGGARPRTIRPSARPARGLTKASTRSTARPPGCSAKKATLRSPARRPTCGCSRTRPAAPACRGGARRARRRRAHRPRALLRRAYRAGRQRPRARSGRGLQAASATPRWRISRAGDRPPPGLRSDRSAISASGALYSRTGLHVVNTASPAIHKMTSRLFGC